MTGQTTRAKDTAVRFAEENPLALAVAGIAIGAIVAALIPRSRPEDEWMGESSDRLKEMARDAAEDMGEKTADVAEAAAPALVCPAARVSMRSSSVSP